MESIAWFVAMFCLLYHAHSQDLTTLTKRPNLSVTLNDFEKCPQHMDVPSTYDDLTFSMDPEQEDVMYVDGVLNIKEAIPIGTFLEVDVKRCMNEKKISCEKYWVNTFPDICTHLADKGQSWSKFLQHVQSLAPECPIPPGSYPIVEAPIDIRVLRNYSEFTGHWSIGLSFATEEKRYGCMVFDVTMALKRAR